MSELRENIEAGLRLLLKSEKPLYRRTAEVGIEDLNRLEEQLESLQASVTEQALREPIAAYVRRLEPMASTDGLAKYLSWRIAQGPIAEEDEPPRTFPAGGAAVGEKNLRVGQPGYSRIMDEALEKRS